MTVRFYMDVYIHRAMPDAPRLLGANVLTAQEDVHRSPCDSHLLERASEHERVLFSQEDDLLKEAKARQVLAVPFAGVIYAHQLGTTIGRCVEDLELIAKASEPVKLANRVEFLP